MKKILSIALFSLSLLMPCVAKATNWGGGVQDSRYFQDVLKRPFAQMSIKEDWRVVNITPDKNSPAGYPIGQYYDAAVSKSVELPGSRSGTFWSGTISSLSSLTGFVTPLPTEFEFEVFPRIYVSRRLGSATIEADKSYAPFRSGGTAIIRYQKIEGIRKYDINRGVTIEATKDDYSLGRKQFDPVYAIPAEWVKFALPAFKFYQANKSLFDDKNVVKNQKRLLELTGDANPFNAVAAAQILAPARGLDAKWVRESIDKSTGYQQAFFTYLAFKNAHPLQQESIDTALRQIINNATSSARLKWIALGLFTAQREDDDSYFALQGRFRTILLRVDKKQKELKTKTPDDEYVNELLISAQVRKRPATPAAKTSNF